ncbi:MAG: APC family permease [Bifidobacteriaceae bacterium]|jgi:amino acid transporter|nr:APC family permease [Bifidobacteriaceae bacterium]
MSTQVVPTSAARPAPKEATLSSAAASIASSTEAATPHLKRTLKLHSIVLIGVAYMAPLIVLGTFGVIATASKGATAMSYLLALVVMLFTASSYGRMASLHPESGSAYTYVGKAISPKLGFLAGWTVLLDYIFLPMVIWLIGASYLEQEFPGVPSWAWILGFIAITTVLNIVGLQVADKVTFGLMLFQVVVLATFLYLSARSVMNGTGAGSSLFSLTPFLGKGSSLTNIIAGSAIAAYSYLGFDAVTTMSEETQHPRRDIPRAIMLVALIGGIVFVTAAYFVQLVHPSFVFSDESSAGFEIAMTIGGNLFTALFIGGLCVSQFTSGIAAQASASRLLYAMGRDGVLLRRVFGRLSRHFATPAINIVIIGIIGLIALFLDVATSTSFVNFGAFTAFTLVNLSVIASYLRMPATERKGRMPGGILRNIVLPLLGAASCFYLLVHLDINAIALGLSWLAIGIVILLVLTHGLRRNPPEMSSQE